MNGDLIDRDSAIDAVHIVVYEFFDFAEDDEESPMTYNDKRILELNKAITSRLKKLPTAERKKGKWIYHESIDVFECSVCGRQMVRNIFDFCPWCGVRMDGDW